MKIPVSKEPLQPLEMLALWLIFLIGGVGYAIAFVIFALEASVRPMARNPLLCLT